MEIVLRTPEHVAAVRAFNSRLRAGGVNESFGIASLLPEAPPVARSEESGISYESYVAIDDGEIRGGYTLKRQRFVVAGRERSIAFLQHPLSEGTVDRRFVLVAPRLLRDALAREPLLYALGIGGHDVAAARLLERARFHVQDVPFAFHVHHAGRFLQQVPALRASRVRDRLSRFAALTGLGSVLIRVLQHGSPWRSRTPGVTVRQDVDFGEWADAIWSEARRAYQFAAVRDARALRELYGGPERAFLSTVVEAGGRPVGWAISLASEFHQHRHFGNLRVGSLVDCLARPGFETAVVRAAAARLEEHDVDVIVTNQTWGPTRAALRTVGFLDGPSNFLFAASPELRRVLGTDDLERFQLTRGDGEGPVNL